MPVAVSHNTDISMYRRVSASEMTNAIYYYFIVDTELITRHIDNTARRAAERFQQPPSVFKNVPRCHHTRCPNLCGPR